MTRTPSISAREAGQALRTALSRGGDWAELFWERHETLQIVLDDGHVEDAISGVDQGAGIRVTKGERTTYANGNVNDVDDLIALAGRAARGVEEGGTLHEVGEATPDEVPRHSTVAIDPRSVAGLLRRWRAGSAVGYRENQAFVAVLSTQLWHHQFMEESARAPSGVVPAPDPALAERAVSS